MHNEDYHPPLTILIIFVNFSMAFAQTEHTIIELDNLVLGADRLAWSDEAGAAIAFDNPASLAKVSRGVKRGGIHGSGMNMSGELYYNEYVTADVIDVEFPPTLGVRQREIAGEYVIRLPDMKRIQMEVMFDLFLDSRNEAGVADFSVEVYERSGSGWEWARTFQQDEDKRALSRSNVYRVFEEEYTTHGFLCNLSEWRDQEVKIVLASRLPATVTTIQRGRWLVARLVSATFDYRFTDGADTGGFSTMSEDVPPYTYYPTEHIPLNRLSHVPDGSLTAVYLQNRWFGYFHGFDPEANSGGTAAFDLRNLGTNLYSISTSVLQGRVLRGSSADTAAPALNGNPFFVVKPLIDNPYTWRTRHNGMTSAFAHNNILHGFVHCDDWHLYPPSINKMSPSWRRCSSTAPDWVYSRIGYVRTRQGATNPGIDLRFVGNVNDVDYDKWGNPIMAPAPILEMFQREDEMNRYNTNPCGPVSDVQLGVGSPSVIKHTDGYYYMFYTRWVSYPPQQGAHYPDITTWRNNYGYIQDQICVARAPASIIESPNYSSYENPWRKYYKDGSFTQPPRPTHNFGQPYTSLSYPVVRLYGQGWRAFPKVHYNEYLQQYMMICTGPEGTTKKGLYLHITSGKNPVNWSSGMLMDFDNFLRLDEEGQPVYYSPRYPSMISSASGHDRAGSTHFYVYLGVDEAGGTPGGHTMGRFRIIFD